MTKIRGIYVLFISVRRDISLKVGALGKVKFNKGSYAYIGSAQNGIKKRVARHPRREKRKFWHIDYLLAEKYVKVEKVLYKEAAKRKECEIAQALFRFGNPVRGFGSSDCSCQGHLFKVKEELFSRLMQDLLKDFSELI
ncbi:MAG: GIY-YIG nuclease family protein [Candidatus Aerophobetes bacterium]|nr:GIY-YIG nuclease family protein [Candidatus Aerophobetes bacterium]